MSMSLIAALTLALCGPEPAQLVEWSSLPQWPQPHGMAGPAAGVHHDHLIVAGGANFPDTPLWEIPKHWHDSIHVLALPDGQWEQLTTTLPEPNAYSVALTHPELGVVMVGGSDGKSHTASSRLIQFDGATCTFQPLPDLPTTLAYAAGVLIGDTVWVVGGQPDVDTPVASNRLFSLNVKSPTEWSEHAAMPDDGRILPVAGTQLGQLFVFSGCALVDGEREYLADAWRYTPSTDTWTRAADMPAPASAAPSPALQAGHDMLIVISGDAGLTISQTNILKDDHPGFVDDQHVYCATTDTWRSGGAFPRQDPSGQAWPDNSTWPVVTVPTVPWGDAYIIPTGEMRPRVRSTHVLVATPMLPAGALLTLDWIVILVYLVVLIAMGFWFARHEHTTDDFFLAGRRIPWWAAGISIFATGLSAITFMAIPAKAYATDWLYFVQSMGIVFVVILVAWLFLPFYRRLKLTTAYEYLERRFSLPVRLLASAQFMLAQLGRVAVVVFLPALALSAVTGTDVYLCIVLMGVLSIVYTVLGGIEVVIWSDVVQAIVLFGGGLLAAGIMIAGIPGGLGGAIEQASAADKLHLVNLGTDWTQPVLYVVLLGTLFNNIIPYTSDQAVIQRYLTTPSERDAKVALWVSGILAIPASIVFFGLGTLLWAFYKAHPESLAPLGAVDQILPWFIVNELPAGVSGLIIAAVFAAAMSSIDSSMNSVSTAFTTDFWRRFKTDVDEVVALRTARWATVVFGVAGTGAALLIASMDISSVLDLWFKVLGLFASGLCGLFFLGIFTQRPGTAAALSGLAVSAFVNFAIGYWTDVNVLLISTFGVVSCVVTGMLVGMFAPGHGKVEGLTLASRPPAE